MSAAVVKIIATTFLFLPSNKKFPIFDRKLMLASGSLSKSLPARVTILTKSYRSLYKLFYAVILIPVEMTFIFLC